MYGIEFVFSENWEDYENNKEEEQKANIKRVLDWLGARSWVDNYCSFLEWSNETRHIIIKCGWEQADSAERLFGGKYSLHPTKSVSVRRYEVCQHDNCYKQTMAHGKGVHLYQNYVEAESGYEIHDYCVVHAREDHSRQIARTIETTVEVPGHLWTKIFSFQIDKQFYAQRVEKADEGGYEEGEILVHYPTPWVGPYAIREQAIQAAREYEEECMIEALPEGYKIQPATCGPGFVVMRERYDGAWQSLRGENRKPLRFASYDEAVEAARVQYEKEK
jgi:hypothetical protein